MSSSWTSLVPDVFTNIDANTDSCHGIHRALVASSEVAVLIKDTIVGQIYFVIDASKLAIMNDCGGIVEVTFSINKAEHNGKSSGVANNLVKRP